MSTPALEELRYEVKFVAHASERSAVLQWVRNHWAGFGRPYPDRRISNVYFDTAATPFLYDARVFESVLGLVGAEHILFGSDFPLIAQERVLKDLDDAGIDTEARDLIAGGNAKRILRL